MAAMGKEIYGNWRLRTAEMTECKKNEKFVISV